MPIRLFLVILLAVSLSAIAQYALKLGAGRLSSEEAQSRGMLSGLVEVAASPAIWAGLAIYGVSVALWIWVLARTDLSVAYPFVGLSFVLTMAIGFALLGESMSAERIGGTLLIVAGCVLVARSA